MTTVQPAPPERTIPVTVELPASTWWLLAKVADQRGIRVGQLLAERALRAPSGRPGGRPLHTVDQVAELHADGRSDRDIALALHLTKPTVRYHRIRLGLDPNPPSR